jgi:1,4-dihydroxy-2-naphthoate octaprenyltransferase
MLGRDVALKLFTTMIAIAYVATPLIYIVGIAGPWILVPLITMPKAMSLVRSFYREVPDTAAPQTAQLTILYGIAMALGLALQGCFGLHNHL